MELGELLDSLLPRRRHLLELILEVGNARVFSSEQLVEHLWTRKMTPVPAKGVVKGTTCPMEKKKQLKFTWKALFSNDLIWSLGGPSQSPLDLGDNSRA